MTRFLPWKIVHVAVRQRLPDLSAGTEWGGMFVVFWCDGIPVGQLLIPAPLLPVTSLQLAAMVPPLIAPAVANRLLAGGIRDEPQQPAPDLSRFLELARPLEQCSRFALAGRFGTREGLVSSVSVVICTRNRPESLKKCLASLRALSPLPEEIIVVDNDPSSGLTLPATAAFPEVRYVPEPRPGLSAARNTGIRNCAGAIVAFTDDDVTVHTGWIGAIRDVFHDHGVIAATGLVLPAELATQAQYAFQVSPLSWALGYRSLDFDGHFFRSTRRTGVPVWRMGAGANMAFRRDAFEHVGFFDERLGAGASGCSEDSELWYRLLAEGHRCRYDPAAVVFHAHRADSEELSVQTYNYMRGHVAALLFQFDRYRHWGNLYRAFLALPLYFVGLAFQNLKRTVGRRIFGSGEEAPSLPLGRQIRGVVAGYGYYLWHHRLRADSANPGPRPERALKSSAGGVSNGA
jgi:GT2 family glycosyltransferase